MTEFTWREIRLEDLPAAHAIQPASRGDQLVGAEQANRCWRALLRDPAFRGIVVEAYPPVAGHRIVSSGMGVFVTPEFMAAEIENPQPGLNARIIASIAEGRSVLLKPQQIGRCNAGAGMDIVNLHGSWRHAELNPVQTGEVNTLLAQSFLETFRGYRLHRILREPFGQVELEVMRQAGVFETLAEFPESDSAINLLTRKGALSRPHSMAGAMFRYRNPELRLRPADQRLLLAALNGQTDEELSVELDSSISAVKKRWLAIFDRIAEARPEFFADGPGHDHVRGRQKRHRVLSYVREHPEELRPYHWPKMERARFAPSGNWRANAIP